MSGDTETEQLVAPATISGNGATFDAAINLAMDTVTDPAAKYKLDSLIVTKTQAGVAPVVIRDYRVGFVKVP